MTTDAHDDAIRASEEYQRAMRAVRAVAKQAAESSSSRWGKFSFAYDTDDTEAALLALAKWQQPTEPRACIDCGGPIVYGQKCAVCGQMSNQEHHP